MDNNEMTVTEGSAGSDTAKPPASQMTSNDPHDVDLDTSSNGPEGLDEFSSAPLAGDEPDTLVFDDDTDAEVAFDAEADPDVVAVDNAMSASRKQRQADKNSSIRRLLEERSDARQLEQDIDYLDFDD